MIEYLRCPNHVLHLSSNVLIAGVLVLLAGAGAAYGLDSHLSIPALVAAHSGVIIGATLLKLGYVLRLIGQHYLRKQGSEVCCAVA